MNAPSLRPFVYLLTALSLCALSNRSYAQWTQPTAEELSMTSQPEVPGAAAVYLFREEITEDNMHTWSKYERIKVLTEKGKEYANVELRQYKADEGDFMGGYTISDIEGRTIHPDGKVIPFTGKPYEKLIEKTKGFKEMAKVFTLPDVEVGSIIEYRYKLRYEDNLYIPPQWYVQSELYTRKAHYLWKPTGRQLISKNERGESLTSYIAWSPILPKDAELKENHLPGGIDGTQLSMELNIAKVSPIPDEEHMPPIRSLSYRVLFYYSPYRTQDEFWKNEGNGWAKNQDKFVGPGSKVKAAVAGLLTPAETTDDAKLRKIYAAVMGLENTSFTRSRSAAEDKSQGLGVAKTADDVWERKRGSDDQLARLFVAMARAAGMKAYVMAVSNRDRTLFYPGYMSLSQLDDDIAIVNVGGKEMFFDPGQRFCPYGHLVWKHTFAGGLRQTDSGSAIAGTPNESYKDSKIERIADLTMDDKGETVGMIRMTWTGAPALRWRQGSLKGDSTSFLRDIEESVQHLLPGGMEVKTTSILGKDDYEKPLTILFNVKGAVGSPTGKRLLIPADLFETNSKPTFPHEKRDFPISFEFPYMVQDAVRVKFPSSFVIESIPTNDRLPYQQFAGFQFTSESTPTSYTVRRDFELGAILYKTDEYPDLRAFYGKVEAKSQEPAVLKLAAASAGGQ